MTGMGSWYAGELRRELGERNRLWARNFAHVESYGTPPVIVYEPNELRHGNFFDVAYAAILERPEWMRRFDKIHAQGRALPKAERRWRELDSSMSSDALLMNFFLGFADDIGPYYWHKEERMTSFRSTLFSVSPATT